MSGFIDVLMLIAIPFLVSLNWLIGGNLIAHLPALPLAGARVFLGAAVLLIFSNINQSQSTWSKEERQTWWKQQFLLSITGRIAYYVLSALALSMISPFEAVLFTTLLPVFVLTIERLSGIKFKNTAVPVFAFASAILTVFSISSLGHLAKSGVSSSRTGYILIAAAIFLYAVHLVIYKRTVKDRSAANPLFAQFLIATIVLIPLDVKGYAAFLNLNVSQWLQFLVYAIVCNLVPFVLVHYCLKRNSSFVVGAVSLLSPLMALSLKDVYTSAPIPLQFIVLSAATCLAVFVTIRLDRPLNFKNKVAK